MILKINLIPFAHFILDFIIFKKMKSKGRIIMGMDMGN